MAVGQGASSINRYSTAQRAAGIALFFYHKDISISKVCKLLKCD